VVTNEVAALVARALPGVRVQACYTDVRRPTLADALAGLPRPWLAARIEAAPAPLLRLQDEWEYRRLLELYALLDPELWRRLAARGLRSPVADIREAAAAALDDSPRPP
jgi:hypothetical protein